MSIACTHRLSNFEVQMVNKEKGHKMDVKVETSFNFVYFIIL